MWVGLVRGRVGHGLGWARLEWDESVVGWGWSGLGLD